MTIKLLLSITGICLTLAAFIPYIKSIYSGKTKPHVFSWVIWGSTTFVVFLAQLAAKGGVGAWPFGVSGIITLFIAYLAYQRRADISITRTDWVFFISGMSAIPCWYVTSDPFWAILILTIVDTIAFGPTIRKAYYKPQEESTLFFILMTFRNIVALIALEHYSVTTMMFPAAMAIMCVVFLAVVTVRKIQLKQI